METKMPSKTYSSREEGPKIEVDQGHWEFIQKKLTNLEAYFCANGFDPTDIPPLIEECEQSKRLVKEHFPSAKLIFVDGFVVLLVPGDYETSCPLTYEDGMVSSHAHAHVAWDFAAFAVKRILEKKESYEDRTSEECQKREE